MNEILMCGTDPVGQLYKDTKAEATSIAPIEVSPAESSHSVGTHIMVDGVRYRVTSAISIGDTLTIGTNISAENIEDNLNAENIAYDSNNSVKDKIDEITVKHTTFTGTTLVNGTIATPNNIMPLFARRLNEEGMCFIGYSDRNGSNINYIKVTDVGGTAIVSTNVEIEIFYI